MKSQVESDVQYILDLKEKINTSKNKKSRYEGQYDEVIMSIEKKFNISSIDEAKNLQAKLSSDLQELEVQFGKMVKDLKDQIQE